MNKKKKGEQLVYTVKVAKLFKYPSCVIDENYFLQDLHNKAFRDYVEEISSNKNVRSSDFEVTIESTLPVKVRKSTEISQEYEREVEHSAGIPINRGISVDFVVRELAIADTEKEYGVLDPEKNAEAYSTHEQNIYDDNDEVVDVEIEYYLKEDVERLYQERYNHYSRILRKKII